MSDTWQSKPQDARAWAIRDPRPAFQGSAFQNNAFQSGEDRQPQSWSVQAKTAPNWTEQG